MVGRAGKTALRNTSVAAAGRLKYATSFAGPDAEKDSFQRSKISSNPLYVDSYSCLRAYSLRAIAVCTTVGESGKLDWREKVERETAYKSGAHTTVIKV